MINESNLPKYVLSVRNYLENYPDHELYKISQKLIVDDFDVIKMWESIERIETDPYDDLHVWSFLERAQTACEGPEHHYLSNAERRDLIKDIKKDASRLSRNLELFGLDKNLVYQESKGWHGFYFYEGFSYSRKREIDELRLHKLSIVDLLSTISETSVASIEEQITSQKASKNIQAIRFIRLMAEGNHRLYNTPLNSVLATASNILFGTSYDESDIRKLLSR